MITQKAEAFRAISSLEKDIDYMKLYLKDNSAKQDLINNIDSKVNDLKEYLS